MAHDLPRDDPDHVRGIRFYGPNNWPAEPVDFLGSRHLFRLSARTRPPALPRLRIRARSGGGVLHLEIHQAAGPAPRLPLRAPARTARYRPYRARRAHRLRVLHHGVAGPGRPADAEPGRRMAHPAAGRRQLRRQSRRSHAAMDQRPVRLDHAPGHQHLRRHALLGSCSSSASTTTWRSRRSPVASARTIRGATSGSGQATTRREWSPAPITTTSRGSAAPYSGSVRDTSVRRLRPSRTLSLVFAIGSPISPKPSTSITKRPAPRSIR